jgi:hypothetical protein
MVQVTPPDSRRSRSLIATGVVLERMPPLIRRMRYAVRKPPATLPLLVLLALPRVVPRAERQVRS